MIFHDGPRSRRALVLAAHGSRRNPEANSLVRQIAGALRRRRLYDEVAVAFHQGEPGFHSVLDELEADEVTVVPFLTSAGHYSGVVLPEALSRNRRFGEVRLRVTPPVGTHAGIGPLVARRFGDLIRERGIERGSASLALVGHGTRRHPESRSSTLRLAEALRRRRVAGEVLAAFIDDDPPIESLLEIATGSHLIVVPFLIGGSTHVAQDIPRRLDASEPASVIVDQAVGTYPGLIEIIIDLARRHVPPAATRIRPRLVAFPAPKSRALSSGRGPGTVTLIGAGPGDPGLITALGLELLRLADVVVHDRLIGGELLAEARGDGVLIDVGKGPGHATFSQAEINQVLIDHATRGQSVVRL